MLLTVLLINAPVEAKVLIAAASSIRMPLEKLLEQFSYDTGIAVNVSYGASGNLTHQILRGAPYQLFLAANVDYPQRILVKRPELPAYRIYARGSLDLYAGPGSDCEVSDGLQGLPAQFQSGRIRKLAIAKPDIAPYGQVARQAMQTLGVWVALQPYLVFGNNVAQAAQLAFSGAADCALIAHGLTLSPLLSDDATHTSVPATAYEPVSHAMILLDDASETRVLWQFLVSEAAINAFIAAGFLQRSG